MGTTLACLIYVGDELLEMKMPEPTVCFSLYISAQSPRRVCLAVNTGNGSSDFLKSSEVITTLWPLGYLGVNFCSLWATWRSKDFYPCGGMMNSLVV